MMWSNRELSYLCLAFFLGCTKTIGGVHAPNGFYFVLSIDSSSVVVMEKMGWRPFSGMGQVIFSLLGAKPEGKMQKGS